MFTAMAKIERDASIIISERSQQQQQQQQ